MSATAKEYSGSCLCGDIKVSLPKGTPIIKNIACYCSQCQLNAGGGYQTIVVMKKGDLKLDDPKNYLKIYTIADTESGSPKEKYFCSNCGCTFYTLPMSYGGEIIALRASTLKDGLKDLVPTEAIFTKNRPAFQLPLKDATEVA